MPKAWLTNSAAILALGVGGALLVAAQEIQGIHRLAAETLRVEAEATEILPCHSHRDCLQFSMVLRDAPTIATEKPAWYDLFLSGPKPETSGTHGFYFSLRDGDMVAFPEGYISRLPSPVALYGTGGFLMLGALVGVTVLSKRRET